MHLSIAAGRAPPFDVNVVKIPQGGEPVASPA
jgi:hypothetical protein